MKKQWAEAFYSSTIVSDAQDGWTALELTKQVGPEVEQAARVVFWDAAGQFTLEMSASELPLEIVEELIAEAKAVIRTK